MANESTGTRDETFNLISVLYHALQGAETYQQYIQDAEQRGDQELVQFFRDVREEEKRRADRAKQLLAKHFGKH
jgi:rubrerythrin